MDFNPYLNSDDPRGYLVAGGLTKKPNEMRIAYRSVLGRFGFIRNGVYSVAGVSLFAAIWVSFSHGVTAFTVIAGLVGIVLAVLGFLGRRQCEDIWLPDEDDDVLRAAQALLIRDDTEQNISMTNEFARAVLVYRDLPTPANRAAMMSVVGRVLA